MNRGEPGASGCRGGVVSGPAVAGHCAWCQRPGGSMTWEKSAASNFQVKTNTFY